MSSVRRHQFSFRVFDVRGDRGMSNPTNVESQLWTTCVFMALSLQNFFARGAEKFSSALATRDIAESMFAVVSRISCRNKGFQRFIHSFGHQQ